MFWKIARILAAICMAYVVPAHALGLGEIEVHSKLNQRFSAVIPVIGASAQDLESLQVRMGPQEAFDRAGVVRSDYLSTLEFKLQVVANNATVTVTSAQLDREPFLNFLVEAHWNEGRLLREYTVLLDPPGSPSSASATAAPKAMGDDTFAIPPASGSTPPNTSPEASTPKRKKSRAARSKTEPAAPVVADTASPAVASTGQPAASGATRSASASSEAQTAPSKSLEEAGGGSAQSVPAPEARKYGPVRGSETFWSIANKLRPHGATIDQTLLALCQANPGAFRGGHFDGLRPGSILSVPSTESIKSISSATATAKIAEYRGGARIKAPAKSDVAPVSGTDTESAKTLGASPEPSAPAAASATLAEPAPAVTPGQDSAAADAKLPADNAPASAAPAAGSSPSAVAAPTAAAQPGEPSASATSGAASPAAVGPSTSPADTQAEVAPDASGAPANPAAAPAADANSPVVSTTTSQDGAPGPVPAAEPVTATPPVANVASGAGETQAQNPPQAAAGTAEQYVASVIAWVKACAQQAPSWLAAAESDLPFLAPLLAAMEPYKLPLLGVLLLLLLIFIVRARAARRRAELLANSPAPSMGDREPRVTAPRTAPGFLSTRPTPVSTAGVESTHGFADRSSLDFQESGSKPAYASSPSLPESTVAVVPASPNSAGAFATSPAGAHADAAGPGVDQQFEARTVAVDLNANDPISEADFHVAYGLYDEAAVLLRQALAKEPTRKDLHIKLCETYFAAGKALEYQDAAKSLRRLVTLGEWQKIAIMGRQLAPEAELFKDDGSTAPPEVDLALEEPVAKVQEGSAPPLEPETIPPAPPTPPAGDTSIDFDHPLTPPAITPQSPDSAEIGTTPQDEPHRVDHDVPPVVHAPEHNTSGFDHDEPDQDEPWSGTSAGTIGTDEIGTRLDLARAYADMGDNEAADGLLKEVMAGGNLAQKQEAEALSKRLHSV